MIFFWSISAGLNLKSLIYAVMCVTGPQHTFCTVYQALVVVCGNSRSLLINQVVVLDEELIMFYPKIFHNMYQVLEVVCRNWRSLQILLAGIVWQGTKIFISSIYLFSLPNRWWSYVRCLFDLHLQEKSKKEHEKQVENILKKEKRKRKKMKDLGIDYDFPGYVSMQV